jgi:hypothetical protein
VQFRLGLGPVLITCGIWRDIGLVAFDRARLADVRVLQDHSDAGKAGVQIQINSESSGIEPLIAVVSVSHAGEILQTKTVKLDGGAGRAAMEINDPNSSLSIFRPLLAMKNKVRQNSAGATATPTRNARRPARAGRALFRVLHAQQWKDVAHAFPDWRRRSAYVRAGFIGG